ncbi:MAG: hypothetical protein KF729_37610 [Sandaracinaceae bacterium]|nr:hypothetical protein [Sandaracinaceae bacterium]
MTLEKKYWGGDFGPAPVVVGTAAFNGLGFNAHQSWAVWRADGSALTQSPFRLLNGEQATMALIRSLPPTEYGVDRLWRILARVLKEIEPQLEAIPGTPRVGMWLAVSHWLAEVNDPWFGRVGVGLAREATRWLAAHGGSVAHLLPMGHAGLVDAVRAASEALKAEAIDVAIVGGVDSYADPLVFDILEEEEAIFDQRRTDGFIPGEGAALALLMDEREARSLGRRPTVTIDAIAATDEPATYWSDVPNLGHGLTEVMRTCTARLKHDHRTLDWIFADLTNETYRVREFLVALPRAIAPGGLDTAGATYQEIASPDLVTEFIPDGFGDLGAATMPTALALVSDAFLRGDPDAANCLIVGSSIAERRGAMLVRRLR